MTPAPIEIITQEGGHIAWGPAAASENGVLCLADRVSSSGKRSFFLLRLDSGGRLVAQSKPLPIKEPHHGGAIAITKKGDALIAVYDRREDTFRTQGADCCFSYDQPRWFTCSSKSKELKFTEVGFWKGVDAKEITSASHNTWTSWTMATTTFTKKPEISLIGRLAFGFGSGFKPPLLHEVDVRCHSVAHIAENDESLLALTVSGYKEAKLWRLAARGTVTEIASISPPEQRTGEVSEPALLRLTDGYLAVWRYYNKKIRREERDGGLWFRTCDFGMTNFDQPQRLADDRDIPTEEWFACDLLNARVVVWANGMSRKKQEIRYVRFGARAELPKPPREFPGPLPRHLFRTNRGLVALTEFTSDKGDSSSLQSRCLGTL